MFLLERNRLIRHVSFTKPVQNLNISSTSYLKLTYRNLSRPFLDSLSLSCIKKYMFHFLTQIKCENMNLTYMSRS